MTKLTFRELRKNLKKYLDLMEKGEVFEVRGRALQFMLFEEGEYVFGKDFVRVRKTPSHE